jgi:DnaK suppressor protein
MKENEAVRMAGLKKMLMERKKMLWAELRDDLFRKLGDEYAEQFDSPQDLEDLALIDVIEDTGLAVADIKRQELEMMDMALKKLDDGTYGVCSECGQKIDEARLTEEPFVVYCVKCKAEQEGGRGA